MLRRWLNGESKLAPAYSTEGIVYSFNKIDYSRSLEECRKVNEQLLNLYEKEMTHSAKMFKKAKQFGEELIFLNNRNLWQRIINKQYEISR